MNVTNRRKSTDADTTPTTQRSHHHSQHLALQQHQHHQPHLSYVSCRQAATATATTSATSGHHQRASRRDEINAATEEQEEDDDQEPVVTSTSSDCLLPLLQAEGEGEEISIDLDPATAALSPARITSSTNNYDTLNYNTTGHSTHSMTLEEEMVMPTTSENAARIEREETTSTSTSNKQQLIHRISASNNSRTSILNDMVARDTTHSSVVDVTEMAGNARDMAARDPNDQQVASSATITNSSDTHKIIIKLPKASASCESQVLPDNEEEDKRKVEPLKINLYNTHHHHHTLSHHHTPKITIKPILKESTTDAALVSSEECSSSAEDDIVAKLNNSEPHIVPKLTIRAKNEDYDSSHTTVVPKLTIKINDSTATDGLCKSNAALNTPPLPKLTIKTGQDGHAESIITNVSPASSTNSSSSSLASTSATSMSSVNSVLVTPSSTTVVHKLTIKPIHKPHDFMEQKLPSIPKLCIKTNTLTTDAAAEEPPPPTASKIPKLTIKTGQEHAVIITQHNDNAKNSGGIPKMTIKTKSLDMVDDTGIDPSPADKIPKLTIKTGNQMESSIPKLCINKAQLEAVTSAALGPMSPKQPVVPKLTISRQSVQAERVVVAAVMEGANAAATTTIPKMTIKTQSNKPESVPKITLKSVAKRPSSTEESGVSDDPEEDHMKIMEPNKTVPKLTIKNVGSPQQKLKIVMDAKGDTSRERSSAAAACDGVQLLNANEDVDEFSDLLNVDNAGGESSNSQEFCGFNETAFLLDKPNIAEEYRRQSDDMDIDESLQSQHEPQMFQNASHFAQQNVPLSSGAVVETELNGKIALNTFPRVAHIIDTVDLTSSAGSSPAHRFEYAEDDEDIEESARANTATMVSNSNILLERLQRETSVIQNIQNVVAVPQLQAIPPPLHPKPPPVMLNNTSTSTSRYPELMERLMTNGTLSDCNNALEYNQTSSSTEENIIDSIEILDTPEGSPRTSLDERPNQLKNNIHEKSMPPNGLHYPKDLYEAMDNNNGNLKRHAAQMVNNTTPSGDVSMEQLPLKVRKLQNDIHTVVHANNHDVTQMAKILESNKDEQACTKIVADTNVLQAPVTNHQRSRKQKHEHLLPLPMDEVVVENMSLNAMDSLQQLTQMCSASGGSNAAENNATTMVNKRKSVRSRKSEIASTPQAQPPPQPPPNAKDELQTTPATLTTAATTDNKSRRVQLLRKRLAIDMVDAEQPLSVINSLEALGEDNMEATKSNVCEMVETSRRERNLRTPLRTSRRSNTPTALHTEGKQNAKATKQQQTALSHLALEQSTKKSTTKHEAAGRGVVDSENALNHFLESNSSSTSSTSCTQAAMATTSVIGSLSMATQIDLTMSSSSSNSNGSTTNTVTTVEAATATITRLGAGTNGSGIVNITGGGGSSNNSMLPPTTILSSSDPLQDVVFRPNDFSSIIATQQLRGALVAAPLPSLSLDQSLEGGEMLAEDVSGPDFSEDDSASSSSMPTTPGRSGRGRGGKGSRGGKGPTGRAYRAHRLGRSASAVAKAIAVNRPKWVGALKHTPDPERIKGLFSPSPQVFEEDTRMSADLTQTPSIPPPEPVPATPTRQPDFLNNEESQSSVISNGSILDPNNVLAIQNGSAVKKPVRKKKMEVCVSEETDYTVASIAEYEWPRPKGCCPSKNRDTFMIQEQVANYLGIKSFKRKYPDLPRRQVDMEERNWLQEQGLVSEKMCDLGITAVWASDILDIMYSDFYDKYEEYKDYVRQKHLREIEAKQKSLGLNVAGRGLQARERAMLNTSKWNAYFNKTRKEERTSCLDLQNLVIHKPSPATAPISTIPNRPVAEAVALAAKVEHIPDPPTLLQPRVWEPIRCRDAYYPLSLVPGQFCEKYYNYTSEELRRFPLNTVLVHQHKQWSQQNDESQSSDTDSAVESTENDLDGDTSSLAASKHLRKRRVRRVRNKQMPSNDDEFKIPPLPGASASATSSNDESSSSTDETSSSESDSDTSRSSSSSEESSEDENSPATCGVCLHPQNRNLKNMPELFIQCYTCRRKVHPSCIEMPYRMATRVRNYNWQCAECKCCIKCKGRQDQNKMLFCEQCDRGFHVYCTDVKSVPDGRWSCDRCSFCMRCGATNPEGLTPAQQMNNNNKQTRHKKLKWVNEYRVDRITKIKEHCSMLCVPCGRMRTTKRAQHAASHNNATGTFNAMTSPVSTGALSPNCSSSGQCSPSAGNGNTTITNNHAGVTAATSTSNTLNYDLAGVNTLDSLNKSSTTDKLFSNNSSSPTTALVSSTPTTTTITCAGSGTNTTAASTSSSASAATGGGGGVTPPVVA